MIYSEPLFNQISRFAAATGFGFILCALYIIICFIRFCISDKRSAIIAQDIIFGTVSTVLSFFFMIIYNNGAVRLNLIVSQALGGAVLYICIGRYILRLLKVPALVIRKLVRLILLPLEMYILAFPRMLTVKAEELKRSVRAKAAKQHKKQRKSRKEKS